MIAYDCFDLALGRAYLDGRAWIDKQCKLIRITLSLSPLSLPSLFVWHLVSAIIRKTARLA